jgi:iron complex outermembrane receptor protein
LGATANPFPGLTVTADWYKIKIKDRIVFSEILGVNGSGNVGTVQTAVTSLLRDLGFPQVGAGRFFLNGIDTTTRGLDIVAAYNFRTSDFGRWNVSAAYNRNKTKIDDRAPAPGALAQIPGLILFGRTESLRFTHGQPRDKVVFSADGDFGRFGLTARTTRYGKVVSPSASLPPAPNQLDLETFLPDDIFLGRKWITDFEVRAKLIQNVELAVGANNLFDVYPDRSPFGFNGRYLYGRVSVNF